MVLIIGDLLYEVQIYTVITIIIELLTLLFNYNYGDCFSLKLHEFYVHLLDKMNEFLLNLKLSANVKIYSSNRILFNK